MESTGERWASRTQSHGTELRVSLYGDCLEASRSECKSEATRIQIATGANRDEVCAASAGATIPLQELDTFFIPRTLM